MKLVKNKTNKFACVPGTSVWIRPYRTMEMDIGNVEDNRFEIVGENKKGSKLDFNKMTKDELNDYAAKNNIQGVDMYMTKQEMINKIKGE